MLRLASPDIETLDPQQYADDPSFQVLMAIFEPLYECGERVRKGQTVAAAD